MNLNIISSYLNRLYDPDTTSIQEIREVILRILTISIVIIGTVMLITNAPDYIQANNWIVLGFSIFSLIYLIVLSIAHKGVPFSIRTGSVIAIVYVIGFLSMNNYGLVGDATLWLLFLNIFTTMMLGLRAGLIANLLSLATFIGYGTLITNDIVEIGSLYGREFSSYPNSWLMISMSTVFISLTLSISIGYLIQGLEHGRKNIAQAFSDTKELTSRLEDEQIQLKRRSQDLQRRLVQIRTAAEISRSLGTILNPQELLQEVVDLIKTRFDLYYVGAFLIGDNRRFATLAAGTGIAGQQMIAENHQLSVGGASMVGWATSHGKPRISLDVGQEKIHFRNPHLPDTRSELALPISIGKQINGALSIQSTQTNAFDEDDITVLQGIADSLAIALENARLFEQFEKSLREIQQLNRQYMADSWQNIWVEDEEGTITQERGDLPVGLDFKEINVPLTIRGGQVIGNINLATEQSDFSPEELEFIEAISNQAALALESARLLDEANKRVEQERALRDLTTEFSRALDFETLLRTIVEELGQIPLVKETSIHITPPDQLSSVTTD